MENISIQTSQNIAIEQTIASVGERIVATAIDYSFYAVYSILVTIIIGVSNVPALIILLLPVLFYQLISEASMNGQSWGKKIMNIKVTKIDGSELTFFACFIRWIFRIIDITFLFGAISTIVIILNGKGQRIGDIVANTAVIRLKEESFKETIYSKIPDNYTPVFQQIFKLNDSDIYTAKEIIDFVYESEFAADSKDMAEKAKKAFEAKMGIPSNLPCVTYLETIVKDYNYYHTR